MAKKQKVFRAFGQYKVVRQIGEGGSGRVFEVTDEDGAKCALKLLNPDKSTRKAVTRFRNEMMFGLRKPHPNIIPVLEYGFDEEDERRTPFFVMPFCTESLRSRMKTGIPRDQVLPLFGHLLDAVEAAHLLHVIHRDLKPENILFLEGSAQLQLADFGIARFLEEELYEAADSRTDERLANFMYAAPEQRIRGMKADERSDIYALGLLLNELFTGEVPQGMGFKTIKDVEPGLEYLDRLVAEMIQKQSDKRPASIAVVKERLIGYGNEFVTAQKVNRLRTEVIPSSDLDDPLISNPPQVTGFDWKNGALFIRLSQPVNQKWTFAFQNPNQSFSSPMNQPPQAFRFGSEGAVVSAASDEVQRVIDAFKSWLPMVQRRYQQILEQEKSAAERERRDALRQATLAEETRLRVLRETKI